MSVETPLHAEQRPHLPSLLDGILVGDSRVVLSFAGQGAGCLPELATLYHEVPACRPWVEAADAALRQLAAQRSWRWTGLYDQGFELLRWIEDETTRPDAAYMTTSAISQPLILLTQMARYAWLYQHGLRAAFEHGAIVATTGHSQGALPALLVAESVHGAVDTDRLVAFVRYLAWQGFHMATAWRDAGDAATVVAGASPMAALGGIDLPRLLTEAQTVNATLPEGARFVIALRNTRNRHVASGPPQSLERFRQHLAAIHTRETEARKTGNFGGSPLNISWDYLEVDAAFHSPYMTPVLAKMRESLDAEGFALAAESLNLPAYSSVDGTRFNDAADLREALIHLNAVEPMRWAQTLDRVTEDTQPSYVLDLGPGVGVARLTASALRGSGVGVLALSEPSGREALLDGGAQPNVLDYSVYAPRSVVLPDGTVVVENHYTRATGMSPIILPGMTPTTVDAPIVANAANAGFTAELAGGGQVTERMFSLRLEELSDLLDPGRQVVFNALYLDRYLWDLHLGKTKIVQKAAAAGAPLCGVTISAGIPERSEATALLDELHAVGLWLNAFKPGTVEQVKRVLAIAKATPHYTVFMHLEGGWAGGHHSWEDLEQLLLATYHLVRAQPNVILCVGGGIADEARSDALLTGTWAAAHSLRPMPVDAVLLGTVTMACAEATASASVKQALAAAPGADQWVHAGTAAGGVTSGKSQLNADIHYLDNAAARCGRLLDSVAGDADAVASQRPAIIAALNRTAKPYFGDVAEMTWQAVLKRMLALTAIGRDGRYEDGIWPDISYRRRFAKLVWRAEGRLSSETTDSLVQPDLAALDAPAEVVAALVDRYPAAATSTPHVTDVTWFVRTLCTMPGKPVPFVPVIDQDVRRWYKSDSLWQAQDDRYDADQVLVIPGPAAVTGITRVDEPVAQLLGRFDASLLATQTQAPAPVSARRRVYEVLTTQVPPGLTRHVDAGRVLLAAGEDTAPDAFFQYVGAHYDGPLATVFTTERLTETGQTPARAIGNPVRRLVSAEPGAIVRLELDDDDAMTAIHFHLAEPWDDESVVLTLDDTGDVLIEARTRRVPGAPAAGPWRMTVKVQSATLGGACLVDASARRDAQRRFYHEQLFGRLLEATPLFETTTRTATVEPDRLRAYAALSGARPGADAEMPANMAFSLCWEALFATLSCAELIDGMPSLVHLDNRVEQHHTLVAGDVVAVTAKVERIDTAREGQTITSRCVVTRDGDVCVVMRSRFFVRESRGPVGVRGHETWSADLVISDDAARDFVLDHAWVSVEPGDLAVGDRLRLDAMLVSDQDARGAVFAAQGTISRVTGDQMTEIGSIDLDETRDGVIHPVLAMASALGGDAHDKAVETPRLTLATATGATPAGQAAWADVSRDLNPIHTSRVFASLAGLGQPIVHGMWSAARLHAFVVDAVAAGRGSRITAFEAGFLAPATAGEPLVFEAVRTGVLRGALQVEATAYVMRDAGKVPVVRATASVAPPKTAYIFPGQGIQQQGMGMDGFARSAAARAVWERADRYTRASYGYSILNIVRDNPKAIQVGSARYVHPAGVLNLTQFTQVSMAVLATAQVAELASHSAVVPGAVVAGHSVGEYNAICVTGIMPLEAVIEIVWNRGLTMHLLVPRDARGRSPYRMGVVRPHHAGLRHADVDRLVAEARASSGAFVEVVNYNVRGKQYAVTGEHAALDALAALLASQAKPGRKTPWVEVPGIDVPFHSSVLRDGVPAFRQTLDDTLPPSGPYLGLLGRYVPNLVAEPFSLERSYFETVLAATDSDVIKAILADFEAQIQTPVALARRLLIELLAWQFASPVRWIETQDLMLRQAADGGLGVETVVELGVGYQPTAANMMKQTVAMAGARVRVFNSEADLDVVAHRDEDAEVYEEPAAASAPATASAPASATTSASAAAAPAPAPAPAPVASSGPAVDVPVSHLRALTAILALQAKVRPEQVGTDETIDQLFDGVSSRRNQVLLDIGAEFQLGTIDGAHEQSLTALAAEVARRSPRWRYPGKYLKASQDDALRRALGPAQMSRKDVESYLDSQYGVGPGLIGGTLLTLTLETREGDSARGGVLGAHGTLSPTNKKDGQALVDAAVSTLGAKLGQTLAPLTAAGAAGGGAVDSAVVAELEARILGKDGVLVQGLRDMAAQLGHKLDDQRTPLADPSADAKRLDLLDAEHGSAWEALVAPRFEPSRHVVFASAWAFAQRDVARLYYDALAGRVSADAIRTEVQRLAVHAGEPRVARTAAWFVTQATTQGNTELASALSHIAAPEGAGVSPFVPTRPHLELQPDGTVDYTEQVDPRDVAAWVADMTAGDPPLIGLGGHTTAFRELLTKGAATPFAFAGRTALITGASPNSIAVAMVGHLLRGGARVVVTTTTYNRDRILWYRRFYQRHAGPGAELHVVPFNQASNQDVDALMTWLFSEIVEQDGAKVRVVKPAFVPDIFVPFAALKDMATMDGFGPRAEAAMRVMLLSVERLVGQIATQLKARSQPHRPCHIVLPLSPNHGSFGGDGAYAETKAALEVLATKWHSEQDAWGAMTTLCAATIGWVRGTGLMDANNIVSPALETETGAHTFSNDEMGWLLTGLCTDWARERASVAPLRADLTGGFARIGDVRTVVGDIRAAVETQIQDKKRRLALSEAEAQALQGDAASDLADSGTIAPLLEWPSDWSSLATTERRPWPEVKATLDQTVVIVGAGEVGPCGSARTRFAIETLEAEEALAAPAVLELAWITGLVRYEQDDRGGSWVDVETGESVAEDAIVARYRDAVMSRVGIRFVEPDTAGYDPERATVLATAWLDRDFTFQVQSEAEAREFLAADPDHTSVAYDAEAEGWKVTRSAGAEIRVPRQATLNRRVAGMVPNGFDLARYGIPRDMVESVDRLALMNLVATVDAFISAGLTPEELLRWVHPARVANTQGSGIGGMRSMHRLYVDHLLGRERQSDVLQETLINVITGYVVQAYVGSYGAMSNPVAACATAAVSFESAHEKILAGKADFVVAGGFDDIGLEGEIGFADMNATCDTDQMLAMGLEPNQMSRSNDRRRRGFVGAQGGGTLLLARADVALEMGLPVLGVLAYSGSFGDGIQKSVPAPGMGALACVMGGKRSAMNTALTRYGLTTDDIAVVYKHDTSTGANDPNENALHDQIQTVLGRTEGNPLWVVSQKTLTGHSKGGAAAWQAIGLCQTLATGRIAGNRNLESVDPQMRKFGHMAFTDQRIETGPGALRAGLLTSLGFGHVSAVGLVLHPDAFEAMLDEDQRAAWVISRDARLNSAAVERARILLDERPAFDKRSVRRFKSADGSACQGREESEMLLDPDARLDLALGIFVGGADA